MTIQQWGLPVDEGFYVQSVVPGSPSEAAGVQVGDIVTAVQLERVGEQQSMVGALFKYKPGDKVQLHYPARTCLDARDDSAGRAASGSVIVAGSDA